MVLDNTLRSLTKAELDVIITKALCEKSFYEFFKLCVENVYGGNWDFSPKFYKTVCDILQKEYERFELGIPKQQDLLLNLPFRIGKSTILECYGAWLWIKNPKVDILHVCATQSLTVKSARWTKIILQSQWFRQYWDIELAIDSKAKSNYSTKAGGTHLALSIGSSIIGRNADFLIIDDPNDPADANSETAIKKVIDCYRDVLYSRQNNNLGLRIVCQQRVSTEDLCGWILKNTPSQYQHVCLPALMNKSTSRGLEFLYDGDGYLFPTRYGKKQLDDYALTLSATAYASQLLMSPAALEGTILLRNWFGIIKKNLYMQLKNESVQNILFLDTAMTSNEKNDPSAFYLCNLIGGKIYVVEAEEKWLEFYELVEEIKEWIKTHNIKKVYIEKKASGISVIQELKRQLRGKVYIIGIESGSKSKQERARTIQPYLNNGKVVLVQGGWNQRFLDLVSAFPYGRDDLIDTLVYSVLTLIARRYGSTSTETDSIPAETKAVDRRGMIYEQDEADLYS